MWLAVSIALIAASGLSAPFTQRLHATGLWAGRVMVRPEHGSTMPRGLQDALTDGWPSTAVLASSLAPFAAALAGFMYSWWAGLAALVASIILSAQVGRSSLVPATVDYYLSVLLKHAMRRHADFTARGDAMRAEAAKDLVDLLQPIVYQYLNSGAPAPTMMAAKSAPFGESGSLLRSAAA